MNETSVFEAAGGGGSASEVISQVSVDLGAALRGLFHPQILHPVIHRSPDIVRRLLFILHWQLFLHRFALALRGMRIGLPLGLFVLMRMMATALDLRRKFPGHGQIAGFATPGMAAALPENLAETVTPLKSVRKVRARHEFGLRSRNDDQPVPPPPDSKRKR